MSLDDDFPPGDGTADLYAAIVCPHCGEDIELAIDPGGGATQQYIEDCEVCCRPMRLAVSWDAHGTAHVEAASDNDA